MADVNIVSDFTPEGTSILIDGKKTKGEVKSISFSMYYSMPGPMVGEGDPVPCICASYETCEMADDGTEKRTTYRICKEGDDNMIADSTDTSLTQNQIVDFLVRKMQGKL